VRETFDENGMAENRRKIDFSLVFLKGGGKGNRCKEGGRGFVKLVRHQWNQPQCVAWDLLRFPGWRRKLNHNFWEKKNKVKYQGQLCITDPADSSTLQTNYRGHAAISLERSKDFGGVIGWETFR